MIAGDAMLATSPMNAPIVNITPSSSRLRPSRSRISGNRGTKEAKTAPFTKNCTATDASARESVELSSAPSPADITAANYLRPSLGPSVSHRPSETGLTEV